MHWLKQRNILAFPYGWQYPAKTEEWAYLRCLADLPDNRFMQMVCFPWATLVDLLRSPQTSKAQFYLDALQSVPPRMTLVRATVCQHIYMKDLLPFFKQLKITDVFWSHAVSDETVLEGIRIHPFPLYPVRCADFLDGDQPTLKPLSKRKYLYSFIGAYAPDLYLTPVREWLFALPPRQDALIQLRGEWHYERHVYAEQVAGVQMSVEQLQQHQQFSQDYAALMQDTVFCLCPSGSGPNSIRLWEAIGFGCVPVLMADTLRLPGDADLWQSAIVRIPEVESEVKSLPQFLQNIAIDDVNTEAVATLWQRYGIGDFIYDIKRLSIKKQRGQKQSGQTPILFKVTKFRLGLHPKAQ